MQLVRSVRAAVPAAALALSLLAPSMAQAITLSGVVAHPVAANGCPAAAPAPAASPVTAAAATHRDLCVKFDVAGGDAKDLTVHLAPGLLGDPSASKAKCPRATFQTGSCDAATTQVGTVQAVADVAPLGLLSTEQTFNGQVFNLEPTPTEPARLGIFIDPGIPGAEPIRLQTSIRTRLTDYGLDSVTAGIPTTATALGGAPVADVHTKRMALTLWGPSGGRSSLAKPFVTLPTSCGPATTTVDITPYSGAPASGAETFTTTACDQVPFTPQLVVGPKTPTADEVGEASATLVVDRSGDATGPVQSHVKTVVLRLPTGLALSPGLANGLEACTPEQFGLKEDRAPACPDSSVIGDVQFDTPFFAQPLTGKVYFGTPTATAKLRNFVSVEDPRLRVKLIGDVRVDPATGQVTNVFENSPQVPFTRFLFRYQGGPRAVLTSPTTCGQFSAEAAMTPWSDGAPVAPTDTFETVGCPPAAFTPGLGADVAGTVAGADTALTVHITRPDRQTRLLNSTVSLPPGLSGRLGSVPQCPIGAARAAGCGEESRIGSARVTVGTGPAPLTLPGTVFLTSPVNGGVAGMAIVIPAKVGPIDLGTVVSIAALKLRPGDAGVDVVTEDLPQIVDGVPTPYRAIDLTIDRPGFLVNATSCDPQIVHGTFGAVDGTTAGADAPYQATGCGDQPYTPKFSAVLGAKGATGAGAHLPLVTTITQQPGEANTKRTVVTLPAGIGADPQALARACPEEQLLAGGCPASARVGTIEAQSALLPFPLTGTIVLVKPKGGLLPELSLELPLGLRLRATVAFAAGGRLQTVFPGIPDVPLGRLKVAFDGGNGSVLRAGDDLCKGAPPVVETQFTSHGGAFRTGKVAAVVPCSPRLSAKATLNGVGSRRPVLGLTIAASGARLRSVRIALPRQLRAGSAAALRRALKGTIAAAKTSRPTIKVVDGRLVLGGLPKSGASSVKVTLGRGALSLRGAVRRGATLAFKVEGVPVSGKVLRATAKAKAQK